MQSKKQPQEPVVQDTAFQNGGVYLSCKFHKGLSQAQVLSDGRNFCLQCFEEIQAQHQKELNLPDFVKEADQAFHSNEALIKQYEDKIGLFGVSCSPLILLIARQYGKVNELKEHFELPQLRKTFKLLSAQNKAVKEEKMQNWLSLYQQLSEAIDEKGQEFDKAFETLKIFQLSLAEEFLKVPDAIAGLEEELSKSHSSEASTAGFFLAFTQLKNLEIEAKNQKIEYLEEEVNFREGMTRSLQSELEAEKLELSEVKEIQYSLYEQLDSLQTRRFMQVRVFEEVMKLKTPEEYGEYLRKNFDKDKELKSCKANDSPAFYCDKVCEFFDQNTGESFEEREGKLKCFMLESKGKFHLQCLLVKVRDSALPLKQDNLIAAIKDNELIHYFN